MKRDYQGASFMTFFYIDHVEEDVVVREYLNERRQTCFHVSISNGTEMDIYCWTPNEHAAPLWFNCDTRKMSKLATMVGREIFRYSLEKDY